MYMVLYCVLCVVEQYSSVFNMVWHNRRHNVWTRGAFHKNGWWATHRARHHSGGQHSGGQHSAGGQHIGLDTIEQRGKRKPLRRHRSSSPQREPPLLYITLSYNWKYYSVWGTKGTMPNSPWWDIKPCYTAPNQTHYDRGWDIIPLKIGFYATFLVTWSFRRCKFYFIILRPKAFSWCT